METYEIVMLAILVALEIPAIIILTVGWVKAQKEARGREEQEEKEDPRMYPDR